MSAKQPLLPRKVLTPAEREGLQRRIREHDEDTHPDRDRNLYTPDRVNDPIEAAGIKRAQGVLDRGNPENMSFSPSERSRMNERIKELTARMQKLMVPRSHVNLRASPDPEFRKAVNEMARTEMSQEFRVMAQEFKNLMRALHPGDPNAGNLEHIRPAQR